MPTRSRDWNETMSKKLHNHHYAHKFILALIDEGDDLQTALGRTIRLYGVKEFAAFLKMDEPAIQRAINPEHNPTKQTLEKLLEPFGLRLSAKPKTAA